MCYKYGIIYATYPTNDMSQKEIQQAACRPEIWAQLVERRHGRYYPTFQGRVPREGQRWSTQKPYFQRLTSGGRYFVEAVSPQQQDTRLKIWDLGIPGRADRQPGPVVLASRVLEDTNGAVMVSCCSTPDLILFASTWQLSKRNYKYVSLSLSLTLSPLD